MTQDIKLSKRIAYAADNKLSSWEKFWYGVWCVLSCGATFVTKVIIKKAVLEALLAHDRAVVEEQLATKFYTENERPGSEN